MLRSSSVGWAICADETPWLHDWERPPSGTTFKLTAPETSLHINDRYPRSVNDGAAWRGVGLNFEAAGGVQWRKGRVTVNVAPEVYFTTNGNFPSVRSDLTNRSSYANPYHPGIDYPTRFGSSAILSASFGQSYVSAPVGPLSLTAGVENVWIGAADVYPIILSYTAPGFPHVRASTREALDIRIASLELHVLYGTLRESEYFDTLSANDRHFFVATLAVVRPRFLPELSLGVARAYHDSARISARLLQIPFMRLGNQRPANVIDAVLARWVLPNSDFEVYAEWSRERAGGFADAMVNPERSQGYVVGFQKVYVRLARLVRFYGELIHLGESQAARGGELNSYYTDGRVTQGHTHKGQLLGAAIGPGSDAQLIGVDVYSGRARTGFRLERNRFDDDTYYRVYARRFGEGGHDAEIALSASRTQNLGQVEVEGGVAFRHRHNPYFVLLPNDLRNSLSFNLAVRW